jgi:hypothetical protein
MNLKELHIPQGILGKDEKFIKRANDLFGQFLPSDIGVWKGQRILEANGLESLRFESRILLPTGDEHTSRLTLSPDTGIIKRDSIFLKQPKNSDHVRTLHIDHAFMMIGVHYPGLFHHVKNLEISIDGFYRSREQGQVPWGPLDIFHPTKGWTNRIFMDVNSFCFPLLRHPIPNNAIRLRHNRKGSNDDRFEIVINGTSATTYEYSIRKTCFQVNEFYSNKPSFPQTHDITELITTIGPDFQNKLGIFPVNDSNTLTHHFKTQALSEVKRQAHDYFTPSWAL